MSLAFLSFPPPPLVQPLRLVVPLPEAKGWYATVRLLHCGPGTSFLARGCSGPSPHSQHLPLNTQWDWDWTVVQVLRHKQEWTENT